VLTIANQRMSRTVSLVLTRLATPFTAALFLVSVVSGIGLFVHVGMGYFYDMHGWLSLLLLLPFGFHLWKNWTSVRCYLTRGWLVIPFAITLSLAALFVVPTLRGQPSGDPGFTAFNLLMDASLGSIAPLVHRNAEDLAARLRAEGFMVASINSTLAEIADASGREPPWVLSEIASMNSQAAAHTSP
jgi:hypothetical protein